jgi:sulfite exporter TauE/SafE
MDITPYSTALLMGFLGSLHCVGMCGPIMLILPFRNMEGWKKALGIFLYHFGRISVYAAMGLALHSFRLLFDPAWQQGISLTLGGLLLLFGITTFISKGKGIKLPWLGFVQKQAPKVMGNTSLPAILAGGVLNGLLPCGLVYMALSVATVAPDGMSAALRMYSFGLGTVPALVAVTVLQRRIFASSLSLKKLVPVGLLVLGSLFLVRGMNLGVPYLSPSVEVKGNVVKSSCCMRK